MSLDINEICREIQNWKKYSSDTNVMSSLLRIKSITFEPGDNIPHNSGLHVYPAIKILKDKGCVTFKIQFYVIAADLDTEDALNKTGAGNIIPTEVEQDSHSKDPVSEKVAAERISCWTDDLDAWLDASFSQSEMFQAFSVPGNDFGTTKIIAYFGLRANTDPDPVYFADLIIVSARGGAFEDTVQPVPPFSSTDFALLNYSTK